MGVAAVSCGREGGSGQGSRAGEAPRGAGRAVANKRWMRLVRRRTGSVVCPIESRTMRKRRVQLTLGPHIVDSYQV